MQVFVQGILKKLLFGGSLAGGGTGDMLHSGGDCQAEPNFVLPHFGNFGQVLAIERVQTD